MGPGEGFYVLGVVPCGGLGTDNRDDNIGVGVRDKSQICGGRGSFGTDIVLS